MRTITSGRSFIIKSLAILSSAEKAVRLYVPGRSTTLISASPETWTPSFFSTVFPGQFPTCCDNPVRMLKTVDLPTFGCPASATRTLFLATHPALPILSCGP